MAFTLDDVAKLERAIASGTTRVTLGDRTVMYQDVDAMRRARREMLEEIEKPANAGKKRRTYRVSQTGTGL